MADLGVNIPNDFCQAQPDLVVPTYVNGNTSDPSLSDKAVLVKLPYSINSGNSATSVNSTVNNTQQIGTVWGEAYQRSKNTLYSSAFVKRHTGLLDAASDGNGDLGAIYKTDMLTNTTTLFVDLQSLGINVGTIANDAARGLSTFSDPSADADAFSKTGKVGLGDTDISFDEKYLYTVNLFERKVQTTEQYF